MKIKNYLTAGIAAAVGLLILTGCSDHRSSAQVHELTFSLEGISEVILSYDEEPVTFYESETNDLVIKEYLTESRCSYYAKVDHGDNYIAIREGRKPLFGNGFSRRVAVYLPASYHESLTVTTTDGDIDLSALEMTLHTLRIDSTAGAVKISTAAAQTIHLSTTSGILEADRLEADTIQIATTRGSFSCRTLDGHVTYTTTSGNANIQSAIGSGIYEASHAGQLNVAYTKVTGDLSFYNKNDGIHVTLPADLEFVFQATTKNGSLSTSFQEYTFLEGQTVSGTVGEHPTVTIKMETKNGNIEVEQ